MALTLSNTGISDSSTIEAAHISQSIDALTGTKAYDIRISGSLTLTGSVQSLSGYTGSLFGTSSFATSASVSVSSSRAISASYSTIADAAATSTSASYSLTTTSASYALAATSASFATSATSASYATTASFALNTPIGTPATAQSGSAVTGTSAETIGLVLTINPNTFTTDNFVRYQARFLRTIPGAANITVRTYLNTANTLNGTQVQIGSATYGSTIRFGTITRTLAIRNNTTNTEWSAGSSGDDPTQDTVVPTTSNFDWTGTLYAIVTITLVNIGDAGVISGIFLEKI